MTAEVVVMNRLAVAVAADSAVTVRTQQGQKIYQSGNKLFSLSKHAPVGIMVYGSATFMELPWEVIIKAYRRELGSSRHPTLSKYADDFFRFVRRNRVLFPAASQRRYVEMESRSYLQSFGSEISDSLVQKLKDKEEISESEVKAAITATIKSRLGELRAVDGPESLPSTFPERVKEKYEKEIGGVISEVYEDLPLKPTSKKYLTELLAEIIYRNLVRLDTLCGVVFIGFGEKDVFPKALEYHTRGIADNRLWLQPVRTAEVKHDNSAVIIPFAQSEMVSTFMEGVDPSYYEFMRASLEELFSSYADMVGEAAGSIPEDDLEAIKDSLRSQSQDQMTKLLDGLDQYRVRKHIEPIMSMIGALPMDELARVAESLVNLTSFKRKVSAEAETVAEPIDVAVISRGDGLVWIKRKHYFPSELNPTWALNYLGDQHE